MSLLGQMLVCQETSKEKLVHPNKSKQSDAGIGYRILDIDLIGFAELGELPKSFNLDSMNEGDGVESTLRQHSACWHKSCRDAVNSTKLDRLLKRKASASCDQEPVFDSSDLEESVDSKKIRSSTSRSSSTLGAAISIKDPVCLFCNQLDDKSNLRQIMTDSTCKRIFDFAEITQDFDLLAKLACSDLIARESKYHPSCLLSLYDKASKFRPHFLSEESEFIVSVETESLAFAEVVSSYIEDVCHDNNVWGSDDSLSPISVFKLADLCQMYEDSLGLHTGRSCKAHPTRFKERLLSTFPEMTAVSHGRHVLLSFQDSLGEALHKAKHSSDTEAIDMMYTTKLIRNELFKSKYCFHGSFSSDYMQEKYSPNTDKFDRHDFRWTKPMSYN